MEARYYNAQWGRFLQQDPVFLELGANPDLSKLLEDPQQLNAYARNNPLRYKDPTGRISVEEATQTFEHLNQVNRFIGDTLTFGQYSQAFDTAVQAGQNIRTAYDQGNLNAGVIAAEGAKISNEAVKLVGVSLVNGMTAGEIYATGKGLLPTTTNSSQTKTEPVTSNKLTRPEDVPENWTSKPSQKGGGTVFQNPQNSHESVRVMPGNPNSPNPSQQNPYVVQMSNGKAIDVNGNRVAPNTPAAHVPLEDFKFNQ